MGRLLKDSVTVPDKKEILSKEIKQVEDSKPTISWLCNRIQNSRNSTVSVKRKGESSLEITEDDLDNIQYGKARLRPPTQGENTDSKMYTTPLIQYKQYEQYWILLWACKM